MGMGGAVTCWRTGADGASTGVIGAMTRLTTGATGAVTCLTTAATGAVGC